MWPPTTAFRTLQKKNPQASPEERQSIKDTFAGPMDGHIRGNSPYNQGTLFVFRMDPKGVCITVQ